MYSIDEVFDFIEEEDVSFIRLAFCDVKGKQKNISILPDELARAFKYGISFDASAIQGFGSEVKSDLFLFPLADTLSILPWRPSNGKVVRMYCEIKHPDGSLFELDSRKILRDAVEYGKQKGISVQFGSEYEFYLFCTDENGESTRVPFDRAGYMDVAPEDKGENIRREICMSLIDMGIQPESSHHEEGPGQNEIDFRYSDPVTAADNAMNFMTVVKAAAMGNGLYADFSPKPLEGQSGNGLHINMSVKSERNEDIWQYFMAGILNHIKEITAFLNATEASYKRLGEKKAPKYITWSRENRSQLIRIPAAEGEYKRIELRSPDSTCNPYIANALLIYAGIDGIVNKMPAPEPVNVNLYNADKEFLSRLDCLPQSLEEAVSIARNSSFLSDVLPEKILESL